MNSWNAWRSVLGLASLCLPLIGCGGGDIPDPDADSNAAAEPPAATGPAAPTPAPAPAVAATEAPVAAAPAEPSAPAEAAAPTATPPAEPVVAASAPTDTPAVAATATAAPEAETGAATADPGRAKNASATAELLALGNKPLPVETPASESAPNSATAPGAMPNNMIAGPIPTPGMPAAAANAMPAAPMISPGVSGEASVNAAAPGGEIPGYPGGAEGGNPGGSNEPANFRSPASAVEAFLKALKAKDAERLAEATARRAPTEAAGPKNQKLFASILEQSLTEDDLNDLANKMEGFQVVGFNTPKSTAKFSLILSKSGQNGETYRRTVTARHERDGWKVLDISGVGTIEKPVMMRRGRR